MNKRDIYSDKQNFTIVDELGCWVSVDSKIGQLVKKKMKKKTLKSRVAELEEQVKEKDNDIKTLVLTPLSVKSVGIMLSVEIVNDMNSALFGEENIKETSLFDIINFYRKNIP